MKVERLVAGVRCSEVLAELSAYLDGELAADRRAGLEAHVRGCDLCARFGGEFASTLARLRQELAVPATPPEAVLARLDQWLDDEAL